MMMMMEEFDYEELEAATENFSKSRLVGKGSHGLIYKATHLKHKHKHKHNNNSNNDNSLVVAAIKKPSEGLQSLNDNSKLENEIGILSSLPQNNPYFVNFFGLSHDSDMNKHLVMEYMPNGSLHDLLHGGGSSSTTRELSSSSSSLTWPRRVEIAIRIAKAVNFLHHEVIVHRDIKSDNILFDANWNAKLADFGLAIRLQNNIGGSSRVDSPSPPAGTIGYLDPSYTTPCKLSTKNDVFSFGVVLLEIMSSRKVIDVSRVPSSIDEWARALIDDDRAVEICDSNMTLPTFVESNVRQLLRIAMRCVSSNENQRPTMNEVVIEIESCYAQRIRFFPTSWMHVVILMRRRQKSARRRLKAAPKCALQQGDLLVHHGNFTSGKMLLRDVLADSRCA